MDRLVGQVMLRVAERNDDRLWCAMPIDVCAHITGTVWKVEVEVGDRVESEQVLVILESMKMEMPVEAPEAGSVSAILVKPGAAVEEGEVLLRLDPA